MYLLAIFMSSLEKCVYRSSTHILIELFGFVRVCLGGAGGVRRRRDRSWMQLEAAKCWRHWAAVGFYWCHWFGVGFQESLEVEDESSLGLVWFCVFLSDISYLFIIE